MDNDISDDIKSHLTRNRITYQLVPPHVHRRSAAERALIAIVAELVLALAAGVELRGGTALAKLVAAEAAGFALGTSPTEPFAVAAARARFGAVASEGEAPR